MGSQGQTCLLLVLITAIAIHGMFEFYLRGPYSLPKNRDPAGTGPQSSILIDAVGLGATSVDKDGQLESSIAIDNANPALAGGDHDEKTTKTKKKKSRPLILPNTCYDLGSHWEVLRKDGLRKGYDRFIVLSASIRGPFVPYWSGACWSDLYLDRVTERVKAADARAVDDLGDGLDRHGALTIPAAGRIRAGRRKAGRLAGMLRREGRGGRGRGGGHGGDPGGRVRGGGHDGGVPRGSSGQDYCKSETGIGAGAYFGTNVHPYEAVFFKANRGIDPRTFDLLAAWH
ncbi:hypothetical protein DL767_008140 [Monosporascus sp. MG133]|nr:hypothetical protein DL767_008140 [Monosporascus sp. MG133]